ncbi:MAG TPA: hypothetical protein VH877_15740 [Polyangia bacterium]|jgi:hypothetical protein|nr:hypothetical protein [Polyangia bacterium]
MRRARSLVCVLGLLPFAVLSGCAHATAKTPPASVPRQATAVPPEPKWPVAGTYDWSARSTDRAGDLHVEREEWHLEREQQRVTGYYDRSVMFVSRDMPYRCNQKLSFTRNTRVRLEGTITGDEVMLREVSYQAAPDPCDDGARNLLAYAGRVEEQGLRLRVVRAESARPDAEQVLVRRAAAAEATPRPEDVTAPIGGTWVWEFESVNHEGDLRTEREVWELRETPEGIVGHYVRTVMNRRRGGVFACNQKDHYETTTRYEVHGQRTGDRFTLVESSYRGEPSPCDNGARRLDSYVGAISRGGEELVLSWGARAQLLRRLEPPAGE